MQDRKERATAEVAGLPGVMAYGPTPEAATAKAKVPALRVLADRLEQGEAADGFRYHAAYVAR